MRASKGVISGKRPTEMASLWGVSYSKSDSRELGFGTCLPLVKGPPGEVNSQAFRAVWGAGAVLHGPRCSPPKANLRCSVGSKGAPKLGYAGTVTRKHSAVLKALLRQNRSERLCLAA